MRIDTNLPNNRTGPSASGPPKLSILTPLAARVGQFYRSASSRLYAQIDT